MTDAIWWATFLSGVALGMSLVNTIWLIANAAARRAAARRAASSAEGFAP